MDFMLSKFLPPTDAGKAAMLVPKAFSKAFLDRNPKEAPQNRFLPPEAHQMFDSYREWFLHWFTPPQEGADSLTWEPFSMSCLSCVPTSHYVSAERLLKILEAGTRLFVHTCGLDQSMPSKDQYTFLERLGGKSSQVEVLDFADCGHMGATERPEEFWSAFTHFFESD
jgi:pimeloyl-ACP methyl ester carboxylesterase